MRRVSPFFNSVSRSSRVLKSVFHSAFGHSSDELEVQAYSLVCKSETFGHLSKILDSWRAVSSGKSSVRYPTFGIPIEKSLNWINVRVLVTLFVLCRWRTSSHRISFNRGFEVAFQSKVLGHDLPLTEIGLLSLISHHSNVKVDDFTTVFASFSRLAWVSFAWVS